MSQTVPSVSLGKCMSCAAPAVIELPPPTKNVRLCQWCFDRSAADVTVDRFRPGESQHVVEIFQRISP